MSIPYWTTPEVAKVTAQPETGLQSSHDIVADMEKSWEEVRRHLGERPKWILVPGSWGEP